MGPQRRPLDSRMDPRRWRSTSSARRPPLHQGRPARRLRRRTCRPRIRRHPHPGTVDHRRRCAHSRGSVDPASRTVRRAHPGTEPQPPRSRHRPPRPRRGQPHPTSTPHRHHRRGAQPQQQPAHRYRTPPRHPRHPRSRRSPPSRSRNRTHSTAADPRRVRHRRGTRSPVGAPTDGKATDLLEQRVRGAIDQWLAGLDGDALYEGLTDAEKAEVDQRLEAMLGGEDSYDTDHGSLRTYTRRPCPPRTRPGRRRTGHRLSHRRQRSGCLGRRRCTSPGVRRGRPRRLVGRHRRSDTRRPPGRLVERSTGGRRPRRTHLRRRRRRRPQLRTGRHPRGGGGRRGASPVRSRRPRR